VEALTKKNSPIRSKRGRKKVEERIGRFTINFGFWIGNVKKSGF
jgi:hypothetical protein